MQLSQCIVDFSLVSKIFFTLKKPGDFVLTFKKNYFANNWIIWYMILIDWLKCLNFKWELAQCRKTVMTPPPLVTYFNHQTKSITSLNCSMTFNSICIFEGWFCTVLVFVKMSEWNNPEIEERYLYCFFPVVFGKPRNSLACSASYVQSYCIQVARWAIFMKQNLKLGLVGSTENFCN